MTGSPPVKPFGTPAVLTPGEVPPFPIAADHLSAAQKESIAEAAWKEARGSIKAFGQLVAEHVRGELDLLKKPGAEPAMAPASPAAQAARMAALQAQPTRTPAEEEELIKLQEAALAADGKPAAVAPAAPAAAMPAKTAA